MTDAGALPAAAATPAAATPPTGASTHVSQAHQTDYQPASPAAPAKDPVAASTAEPIKQPPGVDDTTKLPNSSAKDQSAVAFKLPDEYKDKPWASKVKNQEDLYKQIDNLTAAVGKKSVVPNLKDATTEEREAFYSQLRGKDAAEYQMPKTSVPIPEDTQPAVAKLFMDNGISPTQADSFLKGYLELREKQIAEYYNPEGFKKSMETAFGADWEKTTGQVRNTIKGMMNADDQKGLDAIPNNLLGLVYRTLGNVVKAYGIKETDTAHFAGSGKAAPSDIASQRQGWRDQLSALSMRPHETAEKDAIIAKLADSYAKDPRLNQGG